MVRGHVIETLGSEGDFGASVAGDEGAAERRLGDVAYDADALKMRHFLVEVERYGEEQQIGRAHV